MNESQPGIRAGFSNKEAWGVHSRWRR